MTGVRPQELHVHVGLAPAIGPAGRFYRIACPHGTSTGAFLPGRRPIPTHQVMDLLVVNHQVAKACTCSLPTPRPASKKAGARRRGVHSALPDVATLP